LLEADPLISPNTGSSGEQKAQTCDIASLEKSRKSFETNA